MKTIKVKRKSSAITPDRVDELAINFLDTKAAADEAVSRNKVVYQKIMEWAETPNSVETSKGRLVVGNVWQVGYTNMMASPSVDVAALKKYAPKFVKQVIQQVEQVDTNVFIALVESGQIDAETAKKILVDNGIRGKRIVVEKIAK